MSETYLPDQIIKLVPITPEASADPRVSSDPECASIERLFISHYQKAGFAPPWIVYFVINEQAQIVGAGGYKGKPIAGKVEITYGTFQKYQKQGVGAGICRELIQLARQHDPAALITARTFPDNLASIRILQKFGFELKGTVEDEEDGQVLEWLLPNPD